MIKSKKLPNRIVLVFILGTLSAFSPLAIDMYLPGLPNIAEAFETSSSYVQLSITACLLGLAFGQVISGVYSDSYGRKKPLLIGLAVFTFSSLLCIVSPSIEMFILFRFLQGFSGAAGIVIARAIVSDLYSGNELTKFFAFLALIQGLAPILSPIVGGEILRFLPWEGIFVTLALIGVTMFLVVHFILSETLPVEKRLDRDFKKTFLPFSQLIKDKPFMGYCLANGMARAAMFAYIAASPFVFIKIYGISPQLYSIIFAINGTGLILFSQLTGFLSGKIKDTQLFIGGLIISLTGSVFLIIFSIFHPKFIFILICLFFVISSGGIINITSTSLALQRKKDVAGSASAMHGLLGLLMGAFSSPLVSIGGTTTIVSMSTVILLSSLLASISFFILSKEVKSIAVRKTKNLHQ